MLAGKDPVIIFQFSKLADTAFGRGLASIPLLSEAKPVIDQPPIPIYLAQDKVGLYVDTEEKVVDIDTETETLSDGEDPVVNQKGISSAVRITLTGLKNSVGISLLSAMIDQVFDKSTSKEYAISYLNGATTIFRGLLTNFQVTQEANTNKVQINLELSRGQKQPKKTQTKLPVDASGTGNVPLTS